MNFYACGILPSDTPRAILAGGCIRLEICSRAAADSFITEVLVPVTMFTMGTGIASQGFTMGTSPWVRELRSGFGFSV